MSQISCPITSLFGWRPSDKLPFVNFDMPPRIGRDLAGCQAGHEQEFSHAGMRLAAGEMLGEMSLMEATARSANAVTLEDSVLWWMDQAAFHRCLDTLPQLANNLLRLLSQRLRLANEQIQALATKDVESRVARQLLALVKSYGHQTENGDWHLPIRLTQSDLACLIGATRERVNQVMASYQQRRYLSSDKKHHLTLHNLPALMKRLQRSE